jgi:hypothetical protein
MYNSGDGADTIVDGGGNDTLEFRDVNITDVIITSDGKDLVITLKDDPTNKVTISNWIDSANRIENITFTDGSSPNFVELINTTFITNDNISTCREFKIANIISTCRLHVEQNQQNKKAS